MPVQKLYFFIVEIAVEHTLYTQGIIKEYTGVVEVNISSVHTVSYRLPARCIVYRKIDFRLFQIVLNRS